MKKIIILVLTMSLLLSVLIIGKNVLFKTKKDDQKRYNEIKKEINKELERYLYVVQPKCQKGSSRHITHYELVYNAGFDKEKLLDIDKKTYCMVYVPVNCVEEGKLDWKIYISCNNYKDSKFVKWAEPFPNKK